MGYFTYIYPTSHRMHGEENDGKRWRTASAFAVNDLKCTGITRAYYIILHNFSSDC